MHEVLKTDTVLIEARDPANGPGGRVLLSFTGVGHGLGGVDVQRAEFFSAGNGFANTLFLTDITRCWGNALDFEQIGAALAPYLEGREVHALGNSMGGFLAVLASHFWPMKNVVCFVPQYSVRPRVIPKETRWRDYRDAITTWHYSSLEGRFAPETQYYLFSGRKGPDWRQWRRFPEAPNIANVLFPDLGHRAAVHLKRAGVLNPMIEACFAGKFSLDWLNGISPYRAEFRPSKHGGPSPRPDRH